jgi:hypothetical protein
MHFDIISQHHEHKGRFLRKYHIEGIDTIGVFGDEPFSIQFRNSSANKVQVKMSIDGTDIITGKVADLNPQSKMWIVNGNASMELKAWPENHQGGAAFLFGSEASSVAAHTHGDLTAKGIISCAVFIEGYVPPHVDWGVATADAGPIARSSASPRRYGSGQSFGIEREKSLGPAVGAGGYQEQKINTVAGLREPTFSHIIKVRYLWWDDLVAKLQAYNVSPVSSSHPSGFHGTGIDLKDTPRIDNGNATVVSGYQRFA